MFQMELKFEERGKTDDEPGEKTFRARERANNKLKPHHGTSTAGCVSAGEVMRESHAKGDAIVIACEQALLFGRVKQVSRERTSGRRSRALARSCEARFACPNRRACSQATIMKGEEKKSGFAARSRVSWRLATLIIIGAINSALKLLKVFIATFFSFHPRKDARQYQLYFIIPLRLVLLGV